MKSSIRRADAALLLVLAAVAGGYFYVGHHPGAQLSASAAANSHSRPKRPMLPKATAAVAGGKAAGPMTPVQQAEEQDKEIDRGHLRKLHDGVLAFKAKYGRYPEYLSQLVPEFATAEALVSPRRDSVKGRNKSLKSEHPDPGVEKPSYSLEFSNVEGRNGRPVAEAKELQRMEWGNAVPLLRCYAYGKVMNMSYGGDIYETGVGWESDAGTFDQVDKYGWGPGLNVGEMAKVRVTQTDGSPLEGANVWVDGRRFSGDGGDGFSILPNRSFQTNADGYAEIPIGDYTDSSKVRLRAEAPGVASAMLNVPTCDLSQERTLVVEPAQSVGGQVVDASGQPVPNARVFLKIAPTPSDRENSFSLTPTITQVAADSQGHWQTILNPTEASAFAACVATPGGRPYMCIAGQPMDAAAAASGQAVVTLPATKTPAAAPQE